MSGRYLPLHRAIAGELATATAQLPSQKRRRSLSSFFKFFSLALATQESRHGSIRIFRAFAQSAADGAADEMGATGVDAAGGGGGASPAASARHAC